MALRINFLALFGVSESELRDRLENFGCNPKGVGVWACVTLPTRRVSERRLLESVADLRAPFLLASTIDGAAWDLILGRSRSTIFSGTHDFSLLAYRQEYEKELEETIAEGGSISDFLANTYVDPALIADLPSEVRTPFDSIFELQYRKIAAALEHLEIPFAHRELRDALFGIGLSPDELEHDLGNLSYFLKACGLPPVEELLSRSPAVRPTVCASTEVRIKRPLLAGEIADIERPVTAVRGSPTSLRLQDLPRLFRLMIFQDDRVEALLRVKLTAGEPIPKRLASWRQRDDGSRAMIFHSPRAWRQALEKLTTTARTLHLPDDTEIELSSIAPSESGCQTYRGVLRNDIWRIEETHPQWEGTNLTDALAVSASIDARRYASIRDQAEGQRILRFLESQADWDAYRVEFRGKDPMIQRRPEFRFLPGGKPFESWARAVFRVRYGDQVLKTK